ncbi:FG-GAP-like repeat-containing protein [Altibacter sp. HG106]|uniref:FG-GAP-like repeat-containing protein n=1 Tax=Altibacter sp. HG106 TaxID=3023937 RepID=UPI002350CBD2|nr:FG-GAP-like repeat-containing protein [Altibacter sp. HG106]MDC7994938.1 FG-GAP-like repeat-containing protein [Altibacter sp. HG106]
MKKSILLLCVFLTTYSFGQQRAGGDLSFTISSIGTSGTDRAVVDMNGDYLDDVVSVTSTNVQIFYQQEDGSFVETNITTTPADYNPSWSLAAADYDRNGYTDLLYGGGSGVTFMRANNDGTGFTEVSGPEFVFSQRSNFVDINNDGHLDAFVCHDVEPNVYYLNDGDGNLTHFQGGLGDFPSGGNYGSVWIDYDNDRDMDLFIAKCGGGPDRRDNELHNNNGDGTFSEIGAATNLEDSMQTWSSAWGDYDNDGDMDIWIGASTTTDGFHRLMQNNGDGTFTDVIESSGLMGFSATGIENCPGDFNNDGNLDVLSNGNILLGNGDMTFTVESNVLSSSNGAVGDLNNDGFLDAFIGGSIYYNVGNSNNWIAINTVGVESNIHGIGARVEIETDSGVQIRDVRSGEGFRFMSTMRTHFGIGADTSIDRLTIYWPSGAVDEVSNPNINEVITVEEGSTFGLEDFLTETLILYPNPTQDLLNLDMPNGLDNAIYSVFDIQGRRVMNGSLENQQLNVSALTAGNYILRVMQDGNIQTQRFIKK